MTEIILLGTARLPSEPFRAYARLVFSKAVYFETSDRKISLAVTNRSTDCSPVGFRVEMEDFQREMDLESWSILEYDGVAAQINGRWLLRKTDRTFDEAQTIGIGNEDPPISLGEWERLTMFVCSNAGQRPELWKLRLKGQDLLKDSSGFPHVSTVLPLLGWGSGSTPSGDDFLAGLIAGLYYFDRLTSDWRRTLNGQLESTCFLSRHFLREALKGNFSLQLVHFLKTFSRSSDRTELLRSHPLLHHGDTSGRATILGCLTAQSLVRRAA